MRGDGELWGSGREMLFCFCSGCRGVEVLIKVFMIRKRREIRIRREKIQNKFNKLTSNAAHVKK